MRTFQSRTLAMSRCTLDVVMPSAHIFLPSKEVYESIYNRWRPGLGWAKLSPVLCPLLPLPSLSHVRINNDLLMWEPADLLPTSSTATRPPGSVGFKMCKSAFKLGTRGVLGRREGGVLVRAGLGQPSTSPSHRPTCSLRLRLR